MSVVFCVLVVLCWSAKLLVGMFLDAILLSAKLLAGMCVSRLPCLQNCVKNLLQQTTPQVTLNLSSYLSPLPSLNPRYIPSVGWCARDATLWLYNYYFWSFNVYISVNRVKHSVLTLVDEIRRYKKWLSLFVFVFSNGVLLDMSQDSSTLYWISVGWKIFFSAEEYSCIFLCTRKLVTFQEGVARHERWDWGNWRHSVAGGAVSPPSLDPHFPGAQQGRQVCWQGKSSINLSPLPSLLVWNS